MCFVTVSILSQERQNTWADVKGFVHTRYNILFKTRFCSCYLAYSMKCGCSQKDSHKKTQYLFLIQIIFISYIQLYIEI